MNEPGPVNSSESRAARPVFVSYATADRKQALTVCKAIERRGTKCWISCRDVAPGENYQEQIVRSLRDARAMVLVFSDAANNSDEIKKELSLASRYHVPVMALRIEDVEPSDAFAYELSTRQWIDAFEGWDKSIDALVRKLEATTAPLLELPATSSGPRRSLKDRRPLALIGAMGAVLVAAVAAAFLIFRPFAANEPLTVQIGAVAALRGVPADMPVAFQQELRAAFGDDNEVAVRDKDATYTLGGSIRTLGDKTQFAVQLTDSRTGEMLWSATPDTAPEAGALAPRQAAHKIVWVVRCGLADAMSSRVRPPPRALALYLQHCQIDGWAGGSPERALDVARKVVELAPKFSKGWSSLALDAAFAARTASADKKAALLAVGNEAARRALDIDARNGNAYLAEAELLPQQAWTARETLYKKSVTAHESDCGCEHEHYARFLLSIGRPTEAEAEWRRSLDMNPAAPSAHIGLITTEFHKGDIGAADQAVSDFVASWNGSQSVKMAKLYQATEKRQWAEGMTLAKVAFPNSDQGGPFSNAFAALTSADPARIAAARDALSKMPPNEITWVGTILLGKLGAPEQAFAQIRQANAGGSIDAAFILDPALAPLRKQQGWTALLQQLGLIQYWHTSKKPPEFCKAADAPPVCRMI